uniref:KASH domain-containing protein n=1 Tax=Vespula pensylvanica TaxID=30213 RepID=A0A834P7G4_VESPE|nr:hypothetical protein H0235_004425 [Vespula pensylvanica]
MFLFANSAAGKEPSNNSTTVLPIGNQRLCALQTVQQFSIRLSELQCDLRRDKDTLAVLDVALQAGATSEVASSVRHVARLLSEKQEVHSQDTSRLHSSDPIRTASKTTSNPNLLLNFQNETVIMNDATIAEVTACPLAKFTDQSATLLNQEGGSLSDSGISDSGSEQELSERERRLAALRRLTRSLENQLDPGSEALTELWKRVEDAEIELRDLQKQCRELIVRTAASVESRTVKRMSGQHHYRTERNKIDLFPKVRLYKFSLRSTKLFQGQTTDLSLSKEVPITIQPCKRKKASGNGDNNFDGDAIKDQSEMDSGYVGMTKSEDTGDPENEPDIPHSWIWRILRAALPFQLALVALFCAACLLEPHCCEAANTLNLSLTPQLRYVRGPPPV